MRYAESESCFGKQKFHPEYKITAREYSGAITATQANRSEA